MALCWTSKGEAPELQVAGLTDNLQSSQLPLMHPQLPEVDTELWQAGLSGLAEGGTQEPPFLMKHSFICRMKTTASAFVGSYEIKY